MNKTSQTYFGDYWYLSLFISDVYYMVFNTVYKVMDL